MLGLAKFKNCGVASNNIQPALNTFMGKVQEQMLELHAAKQLSLPGVMPNSRGLGIAVAAVAPKRQRKGAVVAAPAAAADPDDDDDDDGGGCPANFMCARPDGACDIVGQCGWVCCHGVPLLDMQTDMVTVEQFCTTWLRTHQQMTPSMCTLTAAVAQ